MNLNGNATHVCSYSFDNYFAISFKNGKVELFKILKNNDLKRVAKIILCDEEISSVHFLLGPKCIAASYPTGRFYFLDVSLQYSATQKKRIGMFLVGTFCYSAMCTKSILQKSASTIQLKDLLTSHEIFTNSP